MDANAVEWTSVDHALRYLARSDSLPHRVEKRRCSNTSPSLPIGYSTSGPATAVSLPWSSRPAQTPPAWRSTFHRPCSTPPGVDSPTPIEWRSWSTTSAKRRLRRRRLPLEMAGAGPSWRIRVPSGSLLIVMLTTTRKEVRSDRETSPNVHAKHPQTPTANRPQHRRVGVVIHEDCQ